MWRLHNEIFFIDLHALVPTLSFHFGTSQIKQQHTADECKLNQQQMVKGGGEMKINKKSTSIHYQGINVCASL
jgi:hypothetical protein